MTNSSGVSDAGLEASKRALRAQVAAMLPQPGSEAHADACRRAQQRLIESPAVAAAARIAIYRALPSEVATLDATAKLLAAGKDVFFPAMVEGARVLRFLRAHGRLSRGALGVEEPEDLPSARVPLEAIELFVVPALAVDANGHRLGRGKGYYDATLTAAGPRARRVVLVFDAQLVERVPVAGHDERMDAICTDARWLELPERNS